MELLNREITHVHHRLKDTTKAQINANRRDAQAFYRSKTEPGKQRSSLNAVTHYTFSGLTMALPPKKPKFTASSTMST